MNDTKNGEHRSRKPEQLLEDLPAKRLTRKDANAVKAGRGSSGGSTPVKYLNYTFTNVLVSGVSAS